MGPQHGIWCMSPTRGLEFEVAAVFWEYFYNPNCSRCTIYYEGKNSYRRCI